MKFATNAPPAGQFPTMILSRKLSEERSDLLFRMFGAWGFLDKGSFYNMAKNLCHASKPLAFTPCMNKLYWPGILSSEELSGHL
ncbi:hypothetical protein XENTR_v10010967 [Xenopus tropicalis]|nr:hypothetical protein XENTR_v10010967 [Xenopus tropicalis]